MKVEMNAMKIIGIDVAGTTNARDTVAAVFDCQGASLSCLSIRSHLSDQDIYRLTVHYAEQDSVVLGLDAPLSYQFGRGDRPSEISLRKIIKEIGMKPSSVMAPTAPRMIYVTLRGVSLSRGLAKIRNGGRLEIVEVHPGATIGLHYGAVPVPPQILDYKENNQHEARAFIVQWLQGTMSMLHIEDHLSEALTSHEVDACAAALGAWKWKTGSYKWIARSSAPDHPYDFSC